MNEKKYVEVNDLLKHLPDEPYKGAIRRVLHQAPAADVAPVIHARWVNTHSDSEFVQCSLCKYPVYAAWNVTSYCPNCGAKMDKEEV